MKQKRYEYYKHTLWTYYTVLCSSIMHSQNNTVDMKVKKDQKDLSHTKSGGYNEVDVILSIFIDC